MGKLLIVLGVLCMVGAAAVPMIGVTGFQPAALVQPPTSDQYCRTGERLVEESGASTYAPGRGYGSSVAYYCQDASGARREVTGAFANSLLAGAGGMVGSLVTGMLLGAGLGLLGTVFLLLGIVLLVRARMRAHQREVEAALSIGRMG